MTAASKDGHHRPSLPKNDTWTIPFLGPQKIDIVRDPVQIYDFHATLLQMLGVDHRKLTIRHEDRDCRPTDNAGEVVKGIIA